MIGRFRQWLIDTYNGLYVIVLQPHMPSYATVAGVVLAFLFGLLIWGYTFYPVRYYDTAPSQMYSDAQDQWLRMVAGAYQAGYYDQETVLGLLNQVDNPTERLQRLNTQEQGAVQAGIQVLQGLAAQNPDRVTGTDTPQRGGFVSDILPIISGIIVIIILALIVSPVWRLLIKPNIWDKIYEALRPKSQDEIDAIAIAKENRERMKKIKEEEAALRKESEESSKANPYGAPVMQKIADYVKGRDFDESFEIENADDDFLGQCGAAIKESVGGNPAAFEIWLFDKANGRTYNKTFISEAGSNDPRIRGSVDSDVDDPTTDVAIANLGSMLKFDAASLYFEAKVIDVRVNETNPAALDGFKVQMQAWQKGSDGGEPAVPVMTKTVSAATVPAYAPPPPPTFTPPPPTLPQTPPPQPARRPQDDDPFGGTGDFTPIGG